MADGAYLYTNKMLSTSLELDYSFERMGHLLKRLDVGAEDAYAMFLDNDASLVNQPIKKMSRLTQKILSAVDYDFIKARRIENFDFLHSRLNVSNLLKLNKNEDEVPMVYPYRTNDVELKKRLRNCKIFCPTYWPNVKEWCSDIQLEYKLTEEIIAIPIDQRYTINDMQSILKIIDNV
ncbi:hypothetical protein [Flavobacterium sp. N1946]|uniref:hypothetical protein n=1 Tax=Flavobacterium sp. N1946 TaxID=2986826 RepID=UPI002224B0FE|nr:hypothetical protein [Flavobacterium sp. N1946]